MLIQEKPFKHWLDHFYGYGSWDAKIWFVSYEEGGGDLPEEVAEKLSYFIEKHPSVTTPTLCDIRELYKRVTFHADGPRADLFTTLHGYRFGDNAILHGLWKNLIAFVHGYRNKKLPDLLAYQKNNFAQPSSHEALINFYPLPSPHNHAWYYSWLDMPQFPFLKSRAQYEAHVYEQRMKTLLENIQRYKPSVVLMYDMNNINTLKKSTQDFFPGAQFKMVKAVPLQIPQHHRAEIEGTTLILTTQVPALHHNRKETGFDWEMVGRMVNS
jgi:hypothetical protein